MLGPNSGIAFLILAFIVWIFFDFLRIARVRRMMKAIEKHDIDKIKKIADAGLKTRKWLRAFSRKKETNVASIGETTGEVVNKSAKRWGKRILLTRKITPAGLLSSVALTASVQLARTGAGKITDAIDARLQREFDSIAKTNTKTLIILLLPSRKGRLMCAMPPPPRRARHVARWGGRHFFFPLKEHSKNYTGPS